MNSSSEHDRVTGSAAKAAELAARGAYGRLVAMLASRTRDLAAAEDALSEAFVSALATWPRDGVPEKPEAWLLTAARREVIDAQRHQQVEAGARARIAVADEMLSALDIESAEIPDDRLKLLFVCAHPALDAIVRTPLMLQSVMGFDAATIAELFVVSPAAMAQRLVRAKAKIREAGIRFEIPATEELGERLDAVLQCIYAAFTAGWEDPSGSDGLRRDLSDEAIWLGRTVAELMADEPEAAGLLALMLFSAARLASRRDSRGAFVPLAEQDPGLWSRSMIDEAAAVLARAAGTGRPGRFQLEAAIQSVHADRARTGRTEWPVIVSLYEGLMATSPTVGAAVGLAAARAEAGMAGAALSGLEALDEELTRSYQPYWAVRAAVLAKLGQRQGARQSAERAAGLTSDAAVRAWLLGRY